MDKLEIRRILLDEPKTFITFSFSSNQVLLVNVYGVEVGDAVNRLNEIDTFDGTNFVQKRNYWADFMRKCGKDASKLEQMEYDVEMDVSSFYISRYAHEKEKNTSPKIKK